MNDISFECSQSFTINSVLDEPPIPAWVNILDMEYIIRDADAYFRIPFEYIPGRPKVTGLFNAYFLNRNEEMVATPQIILISPPEPITSGDPRTVRTGVIIAWASRQIRDYYEDDDADPLDFEVVIEMFQPDDDGFGRKNMAGDSPIRPSYVERDDEVEVTFDTPERVEGVPVTLETQVDVTSSEDDVVHGDNWGVNLTEKVKIDYGYLEGVLSRDVDPTRETVSVRVKARACVQVDDGMFDTARATIESQWPDRQYIYTGPVRMWEGVQIRAGYDLTSRFFDRTGDEYTGVPSGINANEVNMCFGFIPVAFIFPTRISRPSVPQSLTGRDTVASARFTWDRPGYLGRTFLLRYEYEFKPVDDLYNNSPTFTHETTGKTPSVTIDNLSPGSYKFRLRAVNGGERVSDWVETRLSIT